MLARLHLAREEKTFEDTVRADEVQFVEHAEPKHRERS
jgi:hypothetical protein